ncbi:MAG: alkene reductase [Arenimonas sp.]
MSHDNLLFSPKTIGQLALQNRIAMAPMTRSRAINNIPNDTMREYYEQRNSAGLLITEGTSPSADGLGYARIPGIFTQEQADAWSKIATAVHVGGSKLAVQLMHTGRIGHDLNLPEGKALIAPSAIAAAGQMWTDQQGMQDHPAPKAMGRDDLERVKNDFVSASKLAIAAGLDGVELHAANGYLLGQFLNPRSNIRDDEYGGSAENRRRYVLEVVDAVAAAIGAGRVGIRISPFNPFNDLAANYENEEVEYLALVGELTKRDIAYLHLIATPGAVPDSSVKAIREAFPGPLMLAGDFNRERAEAALASGIADVVAFGKPFIGNPDLPTRLLKNIALNAFNPDQLYTPGPQGYSDYPTVAEVAIA